MTIELSEQQQQVLEATRAADTPEQFRALLDAATPEMDKIVRDIMAPSQPITTTLTELRDLYLTITTKTDRLDAVNYGLAERTRLRDSICLLATANLWLGEGSRVGAYRVRPVAEVVAASKPWRARLKAQADQAFAFEPDIAETFSDVNSTGTMDEEVADLRILVAAVKQHRARLETAGLTEEQVRQGETLLREAEGRDLLGVLGMRSQEEALLLRNRILTYAVLLGRHARAAGVNAFFDDPEWKRRFEAASFREALRRLRPRRGPGRTDEPAEDDAPEQPAAPPAAKESDARPE